MLKGRRESESVWRDGCSWWWGLSLRGYHALLYKLSLLRSDYNFTDSAAALPFFQGDQNFLLSAFALCFNDVIDVKKEWKKTAFKPASADF